MVELKTNPGEKMRGGELLVRKLEKSGFGNSTKNTNADTARIIYECPTPACPPSPLSVDVTNSSFSTNPTDSCEMRNRNNDISSSLVDFENIKQFSISDSNELTKNDDGKIVHCEQTLAGKTAVVVVKTQRSDSSISSSSTCRNNCGGSSYSPCCCNVSSRDVFGALAGGN